MNGVAESTEESRIATGKLNTAFEAAGMSTQAAATAYNEFALMGRDGAEGTTTKTSSVDVHRVLDHVVGGDALALVSRVRKARVG